jgi:hypothetical protein
MVHGPGSHRLYPATDQQLVPDSEHPLEERQVPPPAMQPGTTVVDNQLEDGLSAAITRHPERQNPTPHGHRTTELHITDPGQPPPILKTAWRMEQQVPYGPDSQPVQQLDPFRSNTPEDRDWRVQRRAGFQGPLGSGRFHWGILDNPDPTGHS